MNLGKYTIKTPANFMTSQKDRQCQRADETTCNIKKSHLKHWLHEDLPKSFIVPQRNKWFQHNTTFVNSHKIYQVLADNPKGGIILESHNAILL